MGHRNPSQTVTSLETCYGSGILDNPSVFPMAWHKFNRMHSCGTPWNIPLVTPLKDCVYTEKSQVTRGLFHVTYTTQKCYITPLYRNLIWVNCFKLLTVVLVLILNIHHKFTLSFHSSHVPYSQDCFPREVYCTTTGASHNPESPSHYAERQLQNSELSIKWTIKDLYKLNTTGQSYMYINSGTLPCGYPVTWHLVIAVIWTEAQSVIFFIKEPLYYGHLVIFVAHWWLD